MFRVKEPRTQRTRAVSGEREPASIAVAAFHRVPRLLRGYPPCAALLCGGPGVYDAEMALAYFITFSTYGTWLHGTSKGKGAVDRNHNQPGRPFVDPSGMRESKSHDEMKQPAYTMDAREREIVRDAVVALCLEKRWRLMALHVRSNHVHAVVAVDRDADRVMSDMKARASRALTKAGFDDAARKRWTRHGSTLHLFDEDTVADKVDYTLNRQGVPMAWYDGTKDVLP